MLRQTNSAMLSLEIAVALFLLTVLSLGIVQSKFHMQRLCNEAVSRLEALQKLSSMLEQRLLHYTKHERMQDVHGELLFFAESGELFDRQAVALVTCTQEYRGVRVGAVQLKTILPEKST
jgi:hypothetical protein